MGRVSHTSVTFDSVANKLELRSGEVKKKVAGMLEDGAAIAVKNVRTQMAMYGLVKTGTLRDSIGPTLLNIGDDSASIDVTAKGTRSRGKRRDRNAMIGFVLNYGKKKNVVHRTPRPFFTEGVAESHDQIVELWRSRINDK